MQVSIDGIAYAPACAISSRAGNSLTPHQRADVLKRTLEQHMKYLPSGALVVVVDNGSKPAAFVHDGAVKWLQQYADGLLQSSGGALPVNLIAETPYPAITDPMSWGLSLGLNFGLLYALGQCNRYKADIRQAEKARTSQ